MILPENYCVSDQCLIVLLVFFIFYITLFPTYFGLPAKEPEDSKITLRPCPNPDCIRCRAYKSAQKKALKRLPHLTSEWKRNNPGNKYLPQIGRVLEGVRSGPPPLTPKRNSARNNAEGQFPTVLFIPRLAVHCVATSLHQQICDFLMSKSRIQIMLKEYLKSQIYEESWCTNDVGALKAYSQNQLWQVFYMMNQGSWLQENTSMCRNTYSILQELPQNKLMEKSMFGNIFFSVLYPGTKIEEHCGPTNVRHRLHCPIYVPSTSPHEDPKLSVSGNILGWKERSPFVFDDSLVHSAEYPDNDQAEVRVVLVLDLWHPSLTHDEKKLITDLYPSSCQD
uniref:Aspartyl/asparaginy/proline hydroxylase domain-containing protein n=1 Tax=Chaetoceros debilis TaxID=122233 RepID=A0A7S3PTU6_9STRA|mmetsp:Transcript_15659/g.23458  ORF Transcript_15659/g.23458 Transcript_15659/m.23458 type:complete len:337 (+) Transcript_15659:94-1104(+)